MAARKFDAAAAAAKKAQDRATAAASKRTADDGPDFHLASKDVKRLERAERIVITTALNRAPLGAEEWKTLRRYCDAREAELVVIPGRYRNPTSGGESHAKGEAGEYVWPNELQSYLSEDTLQLTKNIWIMGDVRVQATAKNPLTGLEGHTRGASGIYGHAQLAMEMVPTPQNVLPKILHTTGAITKPLYSKSRAGAFAKFHHTMGALVVEKADKKFHLRQLLFDTEGGFYDLDTYWHTGGSRKAGRIKALVTGDTHVDRVDPGVVEATYGKDGIVDTLRPEVLAWHDLLDFQSESHHNDPIERVALALAGKHVVREEVARACAFVQEHTPRNTLSLIIPSNHNEHLAKWALNADWRKVDAKNAEFLLEMQLAMVRHAKSTPAGIEQIDPFAWWAQENKLVPQPNVRFLTRGESYRAAGIELAFHGDIGPSGARGSRRNLDRVGTRLVIGHLHAPGIFRGCSQVGTSSLLDMVYQRGSPGCWLQTHCAVHQNSKRQLINIIDGDWRAL